MGNAAAGMLLQPMTFAPPALPVIKFGPPDDGVEVGEAATFPGATVAVGEALEAEARIEEASPAEIVDVRVKVLSMLVSVLVGEASGAAVVVVCVFPFPPSVVVVLGSDGDAPLATNAGFPPIAAEEMSSANRSRFVSMNTPRGPAITSALNCSARSFSSGWFVIVM